MRYLILFLLCLTHTVASHASDEARALYEKCKDEPATWYLMSCIENAGTLSFSYVYLYSTSHIEQDLDLAWDYMRSNALSDLEHWQFEPQGDEIYSLPLSRRIEVFKMFPKRIKPGFFDMLDKAMIWAKEETENKTAQELYERAQTIRDDVKDLDMKDSFQEHFFYLAAKAGHAQAEIEYKKMDEAFFKKLREKREKEESTRENPLVPQCDGIRYANLPTKEGLWDRYYTGVPRRRTLCEQRYSDRKLRPKR